jgi:hypothetical protein
MTRQCTCGGIIRQHELTGEREAWTCNACGKYSAIQRTKGQAMTNAFLVKLAKRTGEKRWDFETLKYGDDLYGKETLADDVWELVEERERIGSIAFDEKYAAELAER